MYFPDLLSLCVAECKATQGLRGEGFLPYVPILPELKGDHASTPSLI
jgi:hypothetical protein